MSKTKSRKPVHPLSDPELKSQEASKTKIGFLERLRTFGNDRTSILGLSPKNDYSPIVYLPLYRLKLIFC